MRIHRYKHCTCGLQTSENPSADPTEKPANSLNPGICYIKPLNVPGAGNICQYDQREFDRSLCFSSSKLIEKQLMAVRFPLRSVALSLCNALGFNTKASALE